MRQPMQQPEEGEWFEGPLWLRLNTMEYMEASADEIKRQINLHASGVKPIDVMTNAICVTQGSPDNLAVKKAYEELKPLVALKAYCPGYPFDIDVLERPKKPMSPILYALSGIGIFAILYLLARLLGMPETEVNSIALYFWPFAAIGGVLMWKDPSNIFKTSKKLRAQVLADAQSLASFMQRYA